MKPRTLYATLFAVAVSGLASLPAQAQMASGTTSAYDSSRSSFLPYTRNGYIGLNVGKPHYSVPCGPVGDCDNPSASADLYVGGMFNRYASIEFGYLHMGDADRGGGETRAQGLNLSLVGHAPVWSNLSLYGKVGTTYGRTNVERPLGVGLATGHESGWGPSYGFGATWDFNNNWSAVLDWQRNKFEFAGVGKEWVRATSLGVRYRY
jgi:hypothetical protein